MRRVALVAMTLLACSGEEAERLSLPVRVDTTALAPVDNDLGWRVTLSEARLVMDRLELTIAGETHARRDSQGGEADPAKGDSPLDTLLGLFVGKARAHPGHLADGDVAGELVGPVLVDWTADPALDRDLGLATLFLADYEGANLRLALAETTHGLDAADPLVGHGAFLAGEASKGGRTVRFEAQLGLPEPPIIVGLPFALRVDRTTTSPIGLSFSPYDAIEGDTLFDGLDFGALADLASLPEGDVLTLDDAANNRLRRAFFTHDFFSLTTSETP